jgi:hypothetical protein
MQETYIPPLCQDGANGIKAAWETNVLGGTFRHTPHSSKKKSY